MGKREWEKPATPTRKFESFGPLPFEPLPSKKVNCPKCGAIGKPTGKRSVEGEPIYRCKNCHIDYSEHLKKGFCSFKVAEKTGQRLTIKETGETVFVRAILPSDCKKCPFFKQYFAKKKMCPHFKGRVKTELTLPEQWDKA